MVGIYAPDYLRTRIIRIEVSMVFFSAVDSSYVDSYNEDLSLDE